MSDSKALAIIPRSIDEVMILAAELSKATTIAAEMRDKPANVLAAILAGQELGFSPMAALRSVYIIKGIPKLSADAMVAAVLASGKAQYFEPAETTATSVTYVTKRVGSTREQSCTWTSEMAKAAGLVSDNHRLYPRQMLAARAKSELARSIFPDILAGVYAEEEEFTIANANRDAVDVEIVKAAPNDWIAKMDATTTVDELKALGPEIAKQVLSADAKKQTNDHYRSRMEALRSA